MAIIAINISFLLTGDKRQPLMIKKILLASICCLFYSHYVLASTGYDFANADDEELSCQVPEQQAQLKKYSQFVRCQGKKICVRTKAGDVCFEDQGKQGEEGGINYTLMGVMPENKVVVIRYLGYEEYFDYFISQTTGKEVFELPLVFNGFSQTSRSPNRQYMVVITTNNGYDGNPFLTELTLVKLQPTKVKDQKEKQWVETAGVVWLESKNKEHTYNIQWLNNKTVKISAIAPQNDYIILQRVGQQWQLKEKKYTSWKEYQYIEGG